MGADIRARESELDAMMAKGEILDALAAYYADDCLFEEGGGSRRIGREAQRHHLAGFFATLKQMNAAILHAQATGSGVSMSEWTFDMTGADGAPIVWNEVLVRRWQEDRVISERFYQAPSPR